TRGGDGDSQVSRGRPVHQIADRDRVARVGGQFKAVGTDGKRTCRGVDGCDRVIDARGNVTTYVGTGQIDVYRIAVDGELNRAEPYTHALRAVHIAEPHTGMGLRVEVGRTMDAGGQCPKGIGTIDVEVDQSLQAEVAREVVTGCTEVA